MKTLFKLFAALAVLVALAIATPQAAQAAEPRQYSVVVKVDGAPGDSTTLPGGIDVLTYSWSANIVGTSHTRGGHPELQPFIFVHAYDRASPVLFTWATQAKSIAKVEFFVFRTGAAKPDADAVIHITLKNVLISSISVAGHGELPTQQVTLHYQSIQWEHTKSGAKGGWDNAGNKNT